MSTEQILLIVIGVTIGVFGWLLKVAWGMIQDNRKETANVREKVAEVENRVIVIKAEIKNDLNTALDNRFDSYLTQLDTKLDAWWNKIENNLMNDGRLPPKSKKKEG